MKAETEKFEETNDNKIVRKDAIEDPDFRDIEDDFDEYLDDEDVWWQKKRWTAARDHN